MGSAPGVSRPDSQGGPDREHDDRLEGDLLGLILQAERTVAQLSDERKLSRVLGSMQAARSLIKQVFLFADGRIGVEDQARAFECSQDVFTTANALEERFSRLGRREVEQFFTDGPHESGSPAADYRLFGLAVRTALEGYFVLFAEQFRNPEKVQQWRGTFRVFLDDLLKHW